VFGHRLGEHCAAQATANRDKVIGSARHEVPPFWSGAILKPSEWLLIVSVA
jgi:hypothetical protein